MRPTNFQQADSKWSSEPLIAGSGCGPTSCACIIQGLINSGRKLKVKSITPLKTWKWGVANAGVSSAGSMLYGLNKILAHFGIPATDIVHCWKGAVLSGVVAKNYVKQALKKKCMVLSNMGPGTWTKSGHFVVAWCYKDGKVWIQDPAAGGKSNYKARAVNSFETYWNEVRSGSEYGVLVIKHSGGGADPPANYANQFKSAKSDASSGGEGGGEEGGTTTGGPGVDLQKTISKLMSSDNYQFAQQAKKELSFDETELGKKLKERNKKIVDNMKETLDDVINKKETHKKVAIKDTALDLSYTTTSEIAQKKKKSKNVYGNLFSLNNYVQAPVIVASFNGVTIGGYGNSADKYPNYVNSLQVEKINGRINTYTLGLSHQIRYGEDPNLIDKLLGRAGYVNKLKLTYGDGSTGQYYKEDEAIILDCKQSENVQANIINYTVTAKSASYVIGNVNKDFPSQVGKPSTMIYDLLYSNSATSNELKKSFPGMANRSIVAKSGLIPNADAPVQVGGMTGNALQRLSQLVACMKNPTDPTVIYTIAFYDDVDNKFGGSYFKIVPIKSFEKNDNNVAGTAYEVDIGYPSSNVISFTLGNDYYWPIIHKFSNIGESLYIIDNKGKLLQDKNVNNLYKSPEYLNRSVIDETWWKAVTNYPISANLKLTGLLKPSMLMEQIKINTLFYGKQDIASGLYSVIGQTDNIDSNGFFTSLSLLRVQQ